MLISIVTCMPLAASAAEDESLTTDEQTLKKIGFDIDESGYNLNALKPGTHAVETKNELVVFASLPTNSIPLFCNKFYEFEKNYKAHLLIIQPVLKHREQPMRWQYSLFLMSDITAK